MYYLFKFTQNIIGDKMEINNIITNKDMLYLNDLFCNHNIYDLIDNIINNIESKDIKDILSRIKNMHEDHMLFIISSLKKENYFEGENDEEF